MKTLAYILISQIIIFSSCGKDSSESNVEIIYLREKTINEAKSDLIGSWKIHYSLGYGLSGPVKTLTPNSFFKVLSNDSVYLTINNSTLTEDIVTYSRINTAFGYSAVTMNFPINGEPNMEWIYDYKKGDSLWLSGNCVSCAGYMMTRLP